jgi:glyoxylase-like metal-dependent hydrolase (beta-lactamase superfamily II)
MIKIRHIEVSPFMTNCYLLIDEATTQAALVDPGDEPARIMQMIEEAGAEVKYLLATHGHVDHVAAAAEMKDRLGLDFMICEQDRFLLEALPETCRMYGLHSCEPPAIDRALNGGDTLPLGESTLAFFHAPGHSPGSLLIQAGETDVVVGDVLFAGSIGRTDLPGGSMETLRNSIMQVLLPLGDDLRIHPGHGPATTLDWERQSNPFLVEWARGPH